jgi:hypothetical protein
MALKLKDLAPILADYRTVLVGWKAWGKDSLYRESSPVIQFLVLGRPTYANIYRAAFCLRVLVAPASSSGETNDYWQSLTYTDSRSEANYRLIDHAAKREQILADVRRQIRPPVDEPLTVEAALNCIETKAVPTMNEAYTLAALHAYLGHDSQAQVWIERFHQERLELPWTNEESIIYQHKFIDRLTVWLKEGQAREQLEQLIPEERRKLGLKDE